MEIMAPQIKEEETISFNGKTYEFGKKLGQGGFGHVYKAEMCFNKFFIDYRAIKIVDKRQLSNPQDANREIHMMKSLDHPNIIKLYDAMEIWGNNGENSIYLFMEYASGGDLHNFIKKNVSTEEKAKDIFCQIVFGVEYLHSKGIAHRDLKPQNILLSEGLSQENWHVVKIADFGLSKKFKYYDKMASMCGTPRYAAPEVFDRNVPSYNGCKADIFSLGIILRDLATNYGKNRMPSGAQALFKKLTRKNPFCRPSATEIFK